MPRKYVCLVLLTLTSLMASCNLLTPLVFVGQHTKTIAAEFDKLPGSRVAILVWTDPSTLFDYPHARLELASYVANKLQAEMNGRELSTEVIDPRDVEDFLQKNVHAQVDPYAVGKAFDTDYVVFLEIIRFQMRDRDHPQFLHGQVHASVTVHDVRADPDELRHYPLTQVICEYPDGGPVPLSAINSPFIREGTYRKFAEVVARKFYDHTLNL